MKLNPLMSTPQPNIHEKQKITTSLQDQIIKTITQNNFEISNAIQNIDQQLRIYEENQFYKSQKKQKETETALLSQLNYAKEELALVEFKFQQVQRLHTNSTSAIELKERMNQLQDIRRSNDNLRKQIEDKQNQISILFQKQRTINEQQKQISTIEDLINIEKTRFNELKLSIQKQVVPPILKTNSQINNQISHKSLEPIQHRNYHQYKSIASLQRPIVSRQTNLRKTKHYQSIEILPRFSKDQTDQKSKVNIHPYIPTDKLLNRNNAIFHRSEIKNPAGKLQYLKDQIESEVQALNSNKFSILKQNDDQLVRALSQQEYGMQELIKNSDGVPVTTLTPSIQQSQPDLEFDWRIPKKQTPIQSKLNKLKEAELSNRKIPFILNKAQPGRIQIKSRQEDLRSKHVVSLEFSDSTPKLQNQSQQISPRKDINSIKPLKLSGKIQTNKIFSKAGVMQGEVEHLMIIDSEQKYILVPNSI